MLCNLHCPVTNSLLFFSVCLVEGDVTLVDLVLLYLFVFFVTLFYYILEWSTLKLLSRIRTGPVWWVGDMRKAAVFRTPYGPRTGL